MSFDWSEYLRLAEELAGQGKGPSSAEARLRSAVSRAYYAAYGTARNRLGFSIPGDTPSKHAYVWNQYRASNDLIRREIGLTGRLLHKGRIRADYDDTVSDSQLLAKKALALSATILSRLRRIA